MTADTVLGNVAALSTAMAALAILESVTPFRPKDAWRRGHLAANLGLNASTVALNLVLGIGGAIVSEALRGHGLGLLAGRAIPALALVVVGIVCLDLATYLAHWLMHRVPAFWRVHRVHHSDPLVDVTTAYRQHPLEGLIRFAFIMAAAWALGLPAAVVALYRLVSALNALLEHANVKLWQPLDGLLSLALVTPNMHKVHHSRAQRETDSNYGNILSMFDRLFRTFTPTVRAPHVEYGLDGYDTVDAQRFASLMALPFETEAAAGSSRHPGRKWTAALVLLAASCGTVLAQGPKLDTARIQEITGLQGAFNEEEGVFKVTSPRIDTTVLVDGWAMPPFMGLTSWASFQSGAGGKAMVMGDLVLLQDEVNPVMSALLDAGLEVTALHNHFFFDDPKVYFMHIGGEAPVEQLSRGVRRALDTVKEIRAKGSNPPSGFGIPPLPATSAVTGKTIEEALGVKGQAKDGMFKVVLGRTARAACGCEVSKEMGLNTWAAFAGSDTNAVVDGDFAVRESELQGVLKALRKAEINVVAIHNHMAGETPRFLFLHYWGRGRADALAHGLKAALDTLKAP